MKRMLWAFCLAAVCCAACAAAGQQGAGGPRPAAADDVPRPDWRASENGATAELAAVRGLLGYFVSVERRDGERWAPERTDVYRAPGPLRVGLPAGRFRLRVQALLRPGPRRDGDLLLDVSAGEFTVPAAANAPDAVTVPETKLPLITMAELPDHRDELVRVKATRAMSAVPVRLGSILNPEAIMRHPQPQFGDSTASVIAAFRLVGGRRRHALMSFVWSEALVVWTDYDEEDARGRRRRGKVLYVCRTRPLGLVESAKTVRDRIQFDWDGKTPLPRGKDEDLSQAYRRAVDYLKEHGIPAETEQKGKDVR